MKLRLTAMAMTLLQAACLLGSLVAIVAWPQILRVLGLDPSGAVAWVATAVRWSAVFLMVLLSFALTFYVGPDTRHRWAWITPGSLAGTIAFLVFCILFRLYVQNFGSYDQSLGALGGVMVLLFWFWVVALVLLAAAEMDRAIEAGSRSTGPRRMIVRPQSRLSGPSGVRADHRGSARRRRRHRRRQGQRKRPWPGSGRGHRPA